MASIALKRAASPSLFSGDIPRAVVIVAFVIFLANMLTSGLTAPLWLDENFSAAIATQPSLKGLINWCLNELSGPLYYSLLWAWEKIAGNGDTVLRVPSLFFSLAGPVLLLWKGHEDRTIRYLWAICFALWRPGFEIAADARPYSLMLFLGCAQAICFLRLLKAPTTSRAAIWAGVSSLAVLTHYHAAAIAGLQGVAYLLIWHRKALRTWPALLVLLPMAAWMSLHLPFVLNFASSGYTWYQLTTWKDALFVPLFLCGSVATFIALTLTLPVYFYIRFAADLSPQALYPRFSPEMVLIGTGLLSAALVVGMGFVRPSFSIRYLLPYVGAVSLLIPVLLRDVQHWARAGSMVMVLFLIGSAVPPFVEHLAKPLDDHRYTFNFEQPSKWIMDNSNVRRLVYLWDNPTALMSDPKRLADVGGFFFRRHGRAVDVLIPRYAINADPYPAILALTGDRSDTAIIWAYDKAVPNTSGLIHPPRLSQGRWRCRNFGADHIVVLACLPSSGRNSQTDSSKKTGIFQKTT